MLQFPWLEGVRADGGRGGGDRAGRTDGRTDAAGGRRQDQGGQDHTAQAPHRGDDKRNESWQG